MFFLGHNHLYFRHKGTSWYIYSFLVYGCNHRQNGWNCRRAIRLQLQRRFACFLAGVLEVIFKLCSLYSI